MVKIKKSDIQALLDNYRDSIEKKPLLPSPFRKAARSLPKIIVALTDYITELKASSIEADELTPEQTHQLTLLLLKRKIRYGLNNKEQLSECLVKEFEKEFFNPDEFSELKKHLDSNTLDLDKFITICNYGADNQPRPFQDHEMNIIFAGSPSNKIALSQISRHYHGLFADENAAHLLLLRQLLSHGALGELEQAEAIWRKHPALLECYGTIYHPNLIYKGKEVVGKIPFHHNPGRYQYLNLTYLQILWVNEEYEEAKIIEDILGPAEVARQFFEVFPDGVIKRDNFDLEHAKTLLNDVFKAIGNDRTIKSNNLDQMNEVTREALYALHDYAKPTFEHKTGLVFDPHFYLAALALYDNQSYNRFQQNWCKYVFWCIRVEEWLASCLATGYLRPHAQGRGNNVVQRRGCLLADKSSYFAFRRLGNSIPGLHCFIGFYGSCEGPLALFGLVRCVARNFSSLMSSKKHLSERLMQSCNSSLETNQRPVK